MFKRSAAANIITLGTNVKQNITCLNYHGQRYAVRTTIVKKRLIT